MRPIVQAVYEVYTEKGIEGLRDLDINETLKIISKQMKTEYNAWVSNYQTLISTLQDFPPNVDILLVGYFNSLKEVTINDELTLPVGDIVGTMINLMNKQLKSFAKTYGCTYVDVSDAESSATSEEWTLTEAVKDFQSSTHPTAESMEYISRQIINALPKVNAEGEIIEEEELSYDIVVDLIRYENVSKVTVNGLRISSGRYTVDDTILTVHYSNPFAKSMTVSIVNNDGTISVRTYSLSFTDGHYQAHCIDSTNDVVKTTKQFFTNVRNTFKSIFEGVKNIFIKTGSRRPTSSPLTATKEVSKLLNEEKEEPIEEKVPEENIVENKEDEVVNENQEVINEEIKVPSIEEQIQENKENLQKAKNFWDEQYEKNKERTEEFIEENKENIEKAKEFYKQQYEFNKNITEKVFEKTQENFKKFNENMWKGWNKQAPQEVEEQPVE